MLLATGVATPFSPDFYTFIALRFVMGMTFYSFCFLYIVLGKYWYYAQRVSSHWVEFNFECSTVSWAELAWEDNESPKLKATQSVIVKSKMISAMESVTPRWRSLIMNVGFSIGATFGGVVQPWILRFLGLLLTILNFAKSEYLQGGIWLETVQHCSFCPSCHHICYPLVSKFCY